MSTLDAMREFATRAKAASRLMASASTAQKNRVIEASEPLVLNRVIARDEAFAHRFLDEDLKAFSIFIPVLSGIFALVTLPTSVRLRP